MECVILYMNDRGKELRNPDVIAGCWLARASSGIAGPRVGFMPERARCGYSEDGGQKRDKVGGGRWMLPLEFR